MLSNPPDQPTPSGFHADPPSAHRAGHFQPAPGSLTRRGHCDQAPDHRRCRLLSPAHSLQHHPPQRPPHHPRHTSADSVYADTLPNALPTPNPPTPASLPWASPWQLLGQSSGRTMPLQAQTPARPAPPDVATTPFAARIPCRPTLRAARLHRHTAFSTLRVWRGNRPRVLPAPE